METKEEKKFETKKEEIISENGFQLEQLLSDIPGGVGMFSFFQNHLECKYFNDGFATLSGYSQKEIKLLFQENRLLETMVVPEDYWELMEAIGKCVTNGTPLNRTFRIFRKNGTIEWLHLTANKMQEENGHPLYYCIFSLLSDETRLYRDIVENSAHGVLIVEKESHRIIYVNDSLKKIYESINGTEKHFFGADEIIPSSEILLSAEEMSGIKKEYYSEFHIKKKDIYLEIRAKETEWNGLDAQVFFLTDETAERERILNLQSLVDHIPGGIGIFRLRHGVAHQVYLNDSFYALLSDKRENRVFEKDTDFMKNIHPDDYKVLGKAIHEMESGKDSVALEYRTKTKAESFVWLRLTAKVMERDKENVTIYCCFTDITESMEIKESLEKSRMIMKTQYEQEMERRKILERGSFVNICVNVSKERVISLNCIDNRYEGLPKEFDCETALSVMLKNVPKAEDRAAITHMMNCEYARELYRQGLNEDKVEYRSTQPDGSIRWIRLICDITEDIKTGELIAYGYYYDIDREKKAKQSLNSVISEETEYIMLFSRIKHTARFIHMHNWEAANGLKEEFSLEAGFQTDSFQFVISTDREHVKEFFNEEELVKMLQEKTVATLTFRQKRKDGVIRRKKVRAFYLDENEDHIVIVRRDITDLYEEEQHQKKVLQDAVNEANRANRAKSDFLARMSHDMRTPMNGVLGLAELSSEEQDIEVLHKNIAKIRQSGMYLLSLINDTLDFQKIESGKMELDEKVFDTKLLVDGIVELIRPTAEEKKIDFVVENHFKDADRYLKLDAIHVTQIFVNLLSNSIKFTPEGGRVVLEINNLGRTKEISHMMLRVIDSGCGMSEDYIKHHLFHPFEQERNEISTKYTGSGLGLSIVHNLVKMMNGSIEVESKQGTGTTFTVSLDFKRVNDEKITETKSKLQQNQEEIQKILVGRKILLVEDHPLNAEIAQLLLEKAGCVVQWADDGEKGVKAFTDSKISAIDAILMDIRMPVMNGLLAAAAIRSLDREDAKTVPIIAMTANAYSEDVKKSFDAWMNAHLAKPIETGKMYETIAKLIIERKEKEIKN